MVHRDGGRRDVLESILFYAYCKMLIISTRPAIFLPTIAREMAYLTSSIKIPTSKCLFIA